MLVSHLLFVLNCERENQNPAEGSTVHQKEEKDAQLLINHYLSLQLLEKKRKNLKRKKLSYDSFVYLEHANVVTTVTIKAQTKKEVWVAEKEMKSKGRKKDSEGW